MSDQLGPYTANSLKFILTPSPASLQQLPVRWHHILYPRLLLFHLAVISLSFLLFPPFYSSLHSPFKIKDEIFIFSCKETTETYFIFIYFLILAPILRTLSLSQVSYHRPFLNKDNSLPGPRPAVKKIDFFFCTTTTRGNQSTKNCVNWWKLPVCYLAEQGLELNCFDLNPVHFLLSSYLRNICEILRCLVFWHIYWVCVQLKALC